MDPSYLEVSESTGGQLFLFQRSEIARTSVVVNASHTHPATVVRALGNLNGTRDFEFPVDSSIESLLFLVSLQCRETIRVTRPSGSELTQANSALSVDLEAGRILRIDDPEPGRWRVRLAGTGLFVVSVLAKTEIALAGVAFFRESDPAKEEDHVSRLNSPLRGVRQTLEARLSGHASSVRLRLIDAAGEGVSDVDVLEPNAEGAYRTGVMPLGERFRILVTGTDASAWPFQRVHPVLFRAQTK